mmetsp:Transcript_183399/g.446478  ORF Transcript_183399/g.446478 Transcript_183399/m.446478 type:complete len:112 (+) Transcript_183399:841-1176(+)
MFLIQDEEASPLSSASPAGSVIGAGGITIGGIAIGLTTWGAGAGDADALLVSAFFPEHKKKYIPAAIAPSTSTATTATTGITHPLLEEPSEVSSVPELALELERGQSRQLN